MSPISRTLEIERLGREEILAFLKKGNRVPEIVILEDGLRSQPSNPLTTDLQKWGADAIYNDKQGRTRYVDFKVEEEEDTPNFFLEEWSNRSRVTHGWIWNIRSDFLFYYFLDTKNLYVLGVAQLRKWASGRGRSNGNRIDDFPLKPQSKHTQANDTWGRCVPKELLQREMAGGFTKYSLLAHAEEIASETEVLSGPSILRMTS